MTIGAMAAALATSGCMTMHFLSTDYDERTEAQWLRSFLIDMGVGAALVGTSFLVGDDGAPEPWTLSAGVLSAGMAFILMPLAQYPTPDPAQGSGAGSGSTPASSALFR